MKHIYKCLTAVLLVFAMLATTASFTATAKPESVDLTKPCSLTVNVGKKSELRETNLYVNLYLIAKAVEVEGYDAYTFETTGRYTDFDLSDIQTNEEWRTVAKQVAAVALQKENWDRAAGEGPIETKIEGLEPGLYLVVPHNPETRETVEVTEEDGSTYLATTFDTPNSTYTFTPSLVSLPTKTADDNGVINSAGDGDWLYNAQINLKAEQTDRLGSLEIIKTLTAPPTGGSATFVFSVYGTYWKEVKGVQTELVAIDDVIAITIVGNSTQQSVVIEGIPTSAYITVTEVYEGVRYRLTSDAAQDGIITAEETRSVQFTGEPNGSANSGGGVAIRFTYQGEDGWSYKPTSFGAASFLES